VHVGADGAGDKDFYGLAPGKTVRLLHSYDIKCVGVEGAVLLCEYDAASKSTKPSKETGKIGWLSADAVPVTVNQYQALFSDCEIEVEDEDGKVTTKEVLMQGSLAPVCS
jgi:hypothetical protein